MKIKSAIFDQGSPDLETCPTWALPEFALIGRSNVGKSSLINLLAGQSALAKTSVTPGKTKMINFFIMNGTWSLVDLPGYGYAHVSRRDQMEFNKAVSDYLLKRRNIFRVFVLIDSRLPPQRIDLEFLQWLSQGPAPFSLIFTKTDKPNSSDLHRNLAQFKAALNEWCDPLPEILTCSAKTKAGRTEILSAIEKVLAAHNRA